MVLFFLCLFTSLGLICIRHVRRDFARQRNYPSLGRNGSRKSYGATGTATLDRLDSSNIDEYIEESLYGNWWVLDRLDHYLNSIQYVVTEWLERKRPPVCFEVNPDRTVEAYNEKPQIPRNPNYVPRPFKHSDNYSDSSSPTLQRMFRRHFEINQREKQCQSRESAEDEKSETCSVRSTRSTTSSNKSRKRKGNGIVNRLNERLRQQACSGYSGSDFNDYSADNEYEEIADSDRELSDDEYQRHSSMEVVVTDL